MKRFLTLTTIVLLLGLAPTAMAQVVATTIGTVTDATGALIPGAEVTATNTATGISRLAVTGETGSYSIPGLQPGPYSIVAALPGFADSTSELNLSGGQTIRVNFELQVGAVATAVEVISDADALLATTGASVGDALPENEILSLPLATRDVFDLLDTTAGLVRTSGGDATNFAGTRVSAVNTTRDGVPVSDGRYLDWNGAFAATYSSPDLVEEIQISVGTVDAAAGRGSSQVRLQTRSGTNEYHGALFYTTNNAAFNANNWFDNLRGNKPDWTNRQQFGGRIGGPIVRNKAFFFVLLDEQRYNTRTNVAGEVWTAEARAGNFRYFPGVENENVLAGANASVDLQGNPTRPAGATGPLATFNLFSDVADPYRGTGINQNQFIQETLRRMPLPNDFTGGDGLNTARISWVRASTGDDNAAGTSQDTNRDNLNVRLDYQVSDGNKILFVMSREHNFSANNEPTWPGGINGKQNRDPRIYTLGWTSSISPTVLNEFRYGFRATNWHGRPAFLEGCCFGKDGIETSTDDAKALMNLFEDSNGYKFVPAFQTLGGSKWLGATSLGASRSQNSPLYTFADTISWVSGSHSFTAGWEGTWADSDGWNGGGLWPSVTVGDGQFEADIQGNAKFPGLSNQDAGLAGGILNDLAGSISATAHGYIVNDPSRGFDDIKQSVKQNLNYHQDDWAAFWKDDWNVTQNLTINYGVRWDVYGVPYEGKGLAAVATNGNFLGISGDGTLTSVNQVGKNSLNPNLSIYDRDWNNLAPSFGFSYRVPFTDRTTVVRGGYGVSYAGAPTFLQYDFGVGRQAGKSYTARSNPLVYTALSGTTNPTANLVQFPLPNPIEPFGTIPLTDRRATLYHYAHDRRIPYIQNFNLSIETEIAPDTNLSVSWIATSGVSLWAGRQINEPNQWATSNGESFLDAFKTTRSGGNSAMFNAMFDGINFGRGTCGVVNGTTCTGSMVLRQSTRTNRRVANGESAGLAEYINQTNAFTGSYGGLLRTNGFAENFLVQNPQFNQVDLYDNGDNSSYHSLQLQMTKRLSAGFSGQLSYTWAKSLGNAGTSGFRAREDQSFGTRDWRNRDLNKGVLPFHRTHAINSHGVWELPFGPGRLLGSGAPSAVARLIEGWQLSTIFGWNSGQPITINSGGGWFGAGGIETISAEDNINTADLVGGLASFPRNAGKVVVGDAVVNYLVGFSRAREPSTGFFGTDPDNLAGRYSLYQIQDSAGNVVLSNAKPGTTGQLSPGWLEGPGRLGLDVALMKAVQITEGTDFTLRIDAINMLNTPIWSNPGSNIASSSFGRITSASGERTFTLNARIDF